MSDAAPLLRFRDWIRRELDAAAASKATAARILEPT